MTICTQTTRAEIFMWGALACAQPWFAVGKVAAGSAWTAIALLAWLAARLSERKPQPRQP